MRSKLTIKLQLGLFLPPTLVSSKESIVTKGRAAFNFIVALGIMLIGAPYGIPKSIVTCAKV